MVGAVDVRLWPPTVALTVVGVPARIPVNTAPYFPPPRLTGPERLPVLVPPDLLNTTVCGPVTAFPFWSLAVRMTESWRPELSTAAAANRTDCARLTAPGTTRRSGRGDVTPTPPIVAWTVSDVPTSVPVKVAVYVPSA